MSLLRLGVSSCLLGREVRFDGGHKRDAFVCDALAPLVTWVPVCPEDEAGFGTPREAMRLVAGDRGPQLLTVRTARDQTATMGAFAEKRASQLAAAELDGFIFKKDSPSCGVWRVRIRSHAGEVTRGGRGLFAAAMLDADPQLPVEEEGRLTDPAIREHFVERACARRRLREALSGAIRPGDLMRFHAAHKLQLLAHSPSGYAALGRQAASATAATLAGVAPAYRAAFAAALAVPATRARHVNVLQHIAGYFKRAAGAPLRRELAAAIDDYARAIVPLIVPVTLLAHYARMFDVRYLREQSYLDPHPRTLGLRSHV
jgi:uncharacterized protein YbgA (DUF1722 family)/uncharacterized protein YbbK (DUF523 family)